MQARLARRIRNKEFRTLPPRHWRYDFISNDYLSFARSEELKKKIAEHFLKTDGIGATGSRLLSGNLETAELLEKDLSEFFQYPKALVFPCGFTLNCGLIAAVASDRDAVLMDENAHASLKNGLKLSPAHGFFFKHNDLNHLETRLKRIRNLYENIFIVVESLYSMDGDLCNLEKVLELSQIYGARLIVDEAHAVGSFGEKGRGFLSGFEDHEHLFASVITFGKALGCQGAAVLGSEELIKYLQNFCHSFIYTTGLSTFSLVAMQESLNLLKKDPEQRKQLQERIGFFNKKMGIERQSPIYSLRFSNTNLLREASASLKEKGVGALPIYSPTVQKGKERLRLSLHAHNSEDEIQLCIDALRNFL